MRDLRVQLVAHLGGKPSATQKALIDRICWLSLRVALFDAQAIRDGGLGEHATKQYLAWSNTLERSLRQLGHKGVEQAAPSLKEHLAKHAVAAVERQP